MRPTSGAAEADAPAGSNSAASTLPITIAPRISTPPCRLRSEVSVVMLERSAEGRSGARASGQPEVLDDHRRDVAQVPLRAHVARPRAGAAPGQHAKRVRC